MKRLTKNLIQSSIESYILALETINRPSVSYRLEAFCFLFCNSWELLMKSKLLNDGNNIFYRKRRMQPRRSLSLDDCLNRVFTAENDPIKLNIKTISELRNNAMHLIIPFIPRGIMGLFQAGVLNYVKVLQEWHDIILSDRLPLGMMVLVYDFDPMQHSLQHAKMKRRLPAETFRWLTEFQQSIRSDAESLGSERQQFYIPIDLHLALVKNPKNADITLSSGAGGKKALILEVPKDPNKTHPYRQKDIVEVVNQKLNNSLQISSYDIQCVRQIFKIDSRPEFYYKPKFASPQYSEKFADWMVVRASRKPDFFMQARQKTKKSFKKK